VIVYHVTSYKKLQKYIKAGKINAPVRAWENIQQAERMSVSTSRRIILRLKFKNNADKLDGHFGQARVQQTVYKLESM
jgi:predicted nucleic acid-binding protein